MTDLPHGMHFPPGSGHTAATLSAPAADATTEPKDPATRVPADDRAVDDLQALADAIDTIERILAGTAAKARYIPGLREALAGRVKQRARDVALVDAIANIDPAWTAVQRANAIRQAVIDDENRED